MERICRECGSLVSGEARFCPVCGKTMERAVDLGKHDDIMPAQPTQPGVIVNVPVGNDVGATSGYGAPQYGTGGIPQINRRSQQNNLAYEHMSTGEWFLTIVVCSFFGIISLILNIIWGYSAETPEPKRSFCRAMFYVSLISTIASVVLGIAFAVIAQRLNWH